MANEETRGRLGRGRGRGHNTPEIVHAEPVLVDGVNLSRVSPDWRVHHLREQGHLLEETPQPRPGTFFQDATNLEPTEPGYPANPNQMPSTEDPLQQWLERQVPQTPDRLGNWPHNVDVLDREVLSCIPGPSEV